MAASPEQLEAAAKETAGAFMDAVTHGAVEDALALFGEERPLAVVVTPSGGLCRGSTAKQVAYVIGTLLSGMGEAESTSVSKSVTHGLVSMAVWTSKGANYSVEASTTVACTADGKKVKSAFTTLHGTAPAAFQIEHPLPGCEDEVPPVPEADDDEYQMDAPGEAGGEQ